MPVYNITVDDSSPMIIYSQGWLDTNSSDPQRSSYVNRTFHATNTPDATASFTFFGNAVYVFGAMREGYGPFSVSLDSENTPGNSAVSGTGTGLFQRLLFGRSGIYNGEHTLVLTNGDAGTIVDVDFITFTTGDGNSTTQSSDSIIDDSAPQIIYKPKGSWTSMGELAASYHNDTLHISQSIGASVVVPFTGDAVSLYGATSGNHGTFRVRIDDGEALELNGSSPFFRPQNLLYWAGGIGAGQHQLEFINNEGSLFVDFDFLVATSWTSIPSPPSLASPPSPSPTPGHQSTAKTPIIAGAISGTCVVIAWVVALFFLLRRRRRRRRQFLTADLTETKPEPFILPPDPAVVDGSHRPGEYAFGNGSPSNGKPPRPHTQGAPATSLSTSLPPISSSSGPRTQIQTRSSGSAPTSDLSVSSSPALASSRLLSSSPAVTSSRVLASSKAMVHPAPSEPNQGVGRTTSPATRSDMHPNISASELSTSRTTVPNRPQDWGSVIPLQDDETGNEGLPPDYQEATQPMPLIVTPP